MNQRSVKNDLSVDSDFIQTVRNKFILVINLVLLCLGFSCVRSTGPRMEYTDTAPSKWNLFLLI